VRRWVLGARPRTLWSAVVPVAVGTAIGSHRFFPYAVNSVTYQPLHPSHGVLWGRALLALVVALAVQVGTNYANDYSDGIRGTDSERVGPVRLVASGLATPAAVRAAALLAFGVAAVAGLALAALTTWWLLPIGAACFAAGWLYTGGPHPYGYLGLGELFVFVFFGLVATVGSAYVQTTDLRAVYWVAALPVGFVTVALLEANNLRDVQGDTVAGKRTLAVRLGRPRAGWLYVGALAAAGVGVILLAFSRPWVLLAFLAAPLAVPPVRIVLGGAEGRDLLPVLGATGRLQLVVGALLTLGIVL
jgi:1,4-dihydroxy-2-naphthoate octaprenyltransferase